MKRVYRDVAHDRDVAATSTVATTPPQRRFDERVLPVVYRALGSSRTGIGSGLDESHFFLTDEITPTTPGLFAVAPGYPPAYHMAGRTLQRLNRIDEARGVLNEGIPIALARNDTHAAGEMQELLESLE